MRISDWSSDVCSSDLMGGLGGGMPDLSRLDPKQLEALQKQAEAAGLKPGSMPGLPGGGMPGLPGGGLPGLGGGFPGLPGLPKKKNGRATWRARGGQYV